MVTRETLDELFDRHCMPEPNSGCVIWLGSVLKRGGYGNMHHDGVNTRAHRHAWRKRRGPIPAGMHVLHKCDIRLCVNDEHLFLGTQDDNMKDMARKGRWRNVYTVDTQRDALGRWAKGE